MYLLPHVHALQYPFAENVHPSHFEVSRELSDGAFNDNVTLLSHHLVPYYRSLHQIVASAINPTGHMSDIPYASLITRSYIAQSVHLANLEPRMYCSSDFTWESLPRSATRVHLDASAILVAECIQS
ncbi:hypothetical protein U1Q18_015269, partial [Sarracenia purpurea var. burkii]